MLVQYDCENDDGEDDCQDEHQTTPLVASRLLVSRRLAKLYLSTPGIVTHIFHVIRNRSKLLALLGHNLSHLSEQHIEIADALLNVSDLLFTLDNERFLEVYFVL